MPDGRIRELHCRGFRDEVVEVNDLAPLKTRLGIPGHLGSCHTAEIGGYVLEGQVPASAIKRLLAERPTAIASNVLRTGG